MTLPKILLLTSIALLIATITSSAQTDVGGEGVHKNVNYNQVSTSTPTLDPKSPYALDVYVSPGTTGTLLNTSTVTPPSGSTGAISLNASNNGQGQGLFQLDYEQEFHNKAALDTTFANGTYNFSIKTSTPNTYSVPISTGNDNYPSVIPQITNGTWSGGYLQVDSTQSYTFTWPAFTGSQINFNINGTNVGTQLTADGAHNSYQIAAGTLQANTTYTGQLSFATNPNNTFQSYLSFVIQTGPLSAGTVNNAVLKANDLQQVAANTQTATSTFGEQSCPYSFHANASVAGSVTTPNGSVALAAAAYDTVDYEYYSGPLSSVGNLNTAYPDGSYTLSNSAVVSLTGSVYPNMPLITQVNSAAPVWNGQGQLVLDPNIANTLTWAPFTTTNGSHNFSNSGYIEARVASNGGDYHNEVEAAGFGGQSAFNTLTIPANSLTPGNIYQSRLQYILASSVASSGGVNNVAGYESENDVLILASAIDPFGGSIVGDNLKKSSWYGYYSYLSYPLVFEYNLGYQYVFPASGGVYLYDYATGHFWYTQSNYYPFIYDFSLNTYLYYYPGNGNPRYFYNYTLNKVISE